MIKEACFQNQKNNILIVDDDVNNHLLLDELLKLDYHIIHARSGQQAFDTCLINLQIDLVMMDVRMSGLDGYSSSKMIKKIRPDIPILLQTALDYDSVHIMLIPEIFSDYILKPFDVKILKQKIIRLIRNNYKLLSA